MKALTLYLVLLPVFLVAGGAHADFFVVDNPLSLRSALSIARSNGEPDFIQLEAGIYAITAAFTYTSTENFGLILEGAGIDQTVLDGGNLTQIMAVDTTAAPDDRNAGFTFRGMTFRNGNSPTSGGALAVRTHGGNISISECVFESNTSADQSGGGLLAATDTGAVSVRDSRFVGNGGTIIGGGCFAESLSGAVTFDHNRFSDNRSTTFGGGAYCASSTANGVVVNNVFDANSSANAGGLWAVTSVGTLTLVNNTIVGNTAQTNGGGLLLSLSHNSGQARLHNNIIWNNAAGGRGVDLWVEDDAEGDATGGAVELANNNFGGFEIQVGGDRLTASGNILVDPKLTDDHHLRADSPCIDAGNAAAPQLPEEDFEHDNRVEEVTVDIGADEFLPVFTVPQGQVEFAYRSDRSPLASADPAKAFPLAVGEIAFFGETLDLQVRVGAHEGPVDLYYLLYFPALDPGNVYFVNAGLALQPIAIGMTPWRTNTLGPVSESLYGRISSAGLPEGTYYVGLMVTPAGVLQDYRLWVADFEVRSMVGPADLAVERGSP